MMSELSEAGHQPGATHAADRRGHADAPAMVIRRAGRAERSPALYRRRRRRIETSLAIMLPLVLLGCWEIAARLDWIDAQFFPAPSSIWSAAVDLVRDGRLQHDVLISSRRTVYGFLLGCATGTLCGITLGIFRTARAAVQPLMYALWTVPKLTLLPLLLLLFGLGETPIIVLIAVNCFFLMLIPTIAAISTVPHSYLEASASMEATRLETLRQVQLPCALPQIFVALRLAAGASILVLVAAEFVHGDEGLGYLIWNSWTVFLTSRMYVGILTVAVIGSLFTMLIAAIGRWLTPWAERS